MSILYVPGISEFSLIKDLGLKSFKQSASLSPASKDKIYIELTSFSKIRFSESFGTGAYIVFEVALVEHVEEPGRADHDKGGKYDAIEYSLQKNM